MSMALRVITQPAELTSLAADWDRLAGGVPLRGFAWLSTWWQHYGAANANRTLHVLAQEEQGAITGLAPFYVEHSWRTGRTLRWLGDGEVCTDYVSLLADHARVFAAACTDWLIANAASWDALHLETLAADDVGTSELVNRLRQGGCHVTCRAAGACWPIALPSSWEEYLAQLSKSHRKQLRRLQRQLNSPDFHCWNADHQTFDRAWGVLVELHQRRRRTLGEPGAFASARFAEFQCEVAQQLLDRNELRLAVLEYQNRPIAVDYQLAGQAAIYAYQGGLDPNYLELEPGRLLLIRGIESAIAEGKVSCDLLRGDEPYKAHWRAEPKPFDQVLISSPRTIPWIRSLTWSAANRFRALSRKKRGTAD